MSPWLPDDKLWPALTSMSPLLDPLPMSPHLGIGSHVREAGTVSQQRRSRVPEQRGTVQGHAAWRPCHLKGREQPWEEGGDRCRRGGPGELATAFQGATSTSNNHITWGAFMVCRSTNRCEADRSKGHSEARQTRCARNRG